MARRARRYAVASSAERTSGLETISISGTPERLKSTRLARAGSRVPGRGLLVGVGRAQQRGLVERFADQLEPDGEPALGEAARQREAREPRQVHRDREDVAEVHLERVLLLAELEGDVGGGGGGVRAPPLDSLPEVQPHQR